MNLTSIKACAEEIAAVASAGLIAAQTQIPMSPAAHGWVATALAVLGALAVWAVGAGKPSGGPPAAATTPPAAPNGKGPTL